MKKQATNYASIENPKQMAEDKTLIFKDDSDVRRPKLLLHSCCGPCSTAVIERLASDYDITVFFYNPNITEGEEYQRRLAAQIEFIDKYNISDTKKSVISFIEGDWEVENFYKIIQGMEGEPEGGRRCEACINMRLTRTAELAVMRGFDIFTTTISISPYKNYNMILKLGSLLSLKMGKGFLPYDFKQNDGFKRSVELSKEYGIYRQDYCGCEFARRKEND